MNMLKNLSRCSVVILSTEFLGTGLAMYSQTMYVQS